LGKNKQNNKKLKQKGQVCEFKLQYFKKERKKKTKEGKKEIKKTGKQQQLSHGQLLDP
jgi:hypothetical protein